MATVTVKHRNRPAGSKLEVPLLGVFKNGEAKEVDDLKWARYQEVHKVEGDTLVLDNSANREEAEKVAEIESKASGADDLNDLTIDQLRALADAREVDLSGKHSKKDIIAALEGEE